MKYKHSNADWFWQIDEAENKTEFNQKNKPAMYAEMMAWVDDGNEIEEQETAAELSEREATENQAALDSQPSECIRLLSESDGKVNGAYPNSDADKLKWEAYRAELREIMVSDVLKTIPEKPF